MNKILISCSRDEGGLFLIDLCTGEYKSIRSTDTRGIIFDRLYQTYYCVSSVERSIFALDNKFNEIKRIPFGDDGHGLFFYKDHLYAVCTSEDSIYVYDRNLNYKFVYRFEPKCEYRDAHHINDLYIKDDLMYISMISHRNNGISIRDSKELKVEANKKRYGAVIVRSLTDYSNSLGHIVIDKLSHPHSPMFEMYREKDLYLCNSMAYKLNKYVLNHGKYILKKSVPVFGYNKGICIGSDKIYVGVSRVRESYITNEEDKKKSTGVMVLNKSDLSFLEFITCPLIKRDVYNVLLI